MGRVRWTRRGVPVLWRDKWSVFIQRQAFLQRNFFSSEGGRSFEGVHRRVLPEGFVSGKEREDVAIREAGRGDNKYARHGELKTVGNDLIGGSVLAGGGGKKGIMSSGGNGLHPGNWDLLPACGKGAVLSGKKKGDLSAATPFTN